MYVYIYIYVCIMPSFRSLSLAVRATTNTVNIVAQINFHTARCWHRVGCFGDVRPVLALGRSRERITT